MILLFFSYFLFFYRIMINNDICIAVLVEFQTFEITEKSQILLQGIRTQGKHFRAGITILMTASSYSLFRDFYCTYDNLRHLLCYVALRHFFLLYCFATLNILCHLTDLILLFLVKSKYVIVCLYM